MIKIIVSALIGAGLGGLLGSTRSCKTGGCPLTATPWRGALYGAVLGSFVGLFLGGPSGSSPQGTDDAVAQVESKHLVHVTTAEDFEREVTNGKGIVLVDFYADWCGPCQRLLPVMNEIADEVVGKAKIVKVNVDDLREIAGEYGVSSIPDVRILVNGDERGKWTGARRKGLYLQEIATLYGKIGDSAGTAEDAGPANAAPVEQPAGL